MIADYPFIDILRGAASILALILAFAAAFTFWRLTHSRLLLPWVRWAPAAWVIGDCYVSAREAQQIGEPLFLFGLPLAVAWEVCALVYLHRLWSATGGLKHRPKENP